MANPFSCLISGKIPSKFTEVSVPGVELRVGGGDNRADETPFRITRLKTPCTAPSLPTMPPDERTGFQIRQILWITSRLFKNTVPKQTTIIQLRVAFWLQ
jgi:hypothetical protein